LLLAAVPAYYVGTHSAFSTEYRYVLAIHYFLFVIAAISIYVVLAGLTRAVRARRVRRHAVT
jgi:hypothetical protein